MWGSRGRRDRRLGFEGLEPRLVLTWVGVPPASVALPASVVAVTLNSAADASGTAAISSTEVDYYSFTAPRSGSYTISATTPSSSVDTVLGVFSSSGARLAYNDDIAYPSNTDSRVTISLTAGTRYYVGITNYSTASRGSYTWNIDGPQTTPATPTAPAPTTPTTPVSAFPDVAYFGGSSDWNLNSINAPEVWARGYTGAGVVVAVVDTGVNMNHTELAGSIWTNTREIAGNGIDDDRNGYVDDIHGWDFAANDNNPSDQNGHGTHVAGTIAADKNGIGSTGVAPDALVMPVRVLGSDGSGTDVAVAAGIRYAAQNGADIINLSLGGSFSSAIYAAIQFAQSLDVLVVAAAGNESAAVPSNPARSSATLSNVLSVGAYSSSNAIASFSNRAGSSGAVQVDAPGVSVYSTSYTGGYVAYSGTSMAAPHVAGLAALALSANRSLTASQLRSVIVNGANHTISGSDSRGGINAALTVALAAAGEATTAATASSTTQRASASQASLTRRFAVLLPDAGRSVLDLGRDVAGSAFADRASPFVFPHQDCAMWQGAPLVDAMLAEAADDGAKRDATPIAVRRSDFAREFDIAWEHFGLDENVAPALSPLAVG
jgi:hypothetical protein